MTTLYVVSDEEALRARIAEASGNPDVLCWVCPCGADDCRAKVYYARSGADHLHASHVYFSPTVGTTAQSGWNFGIGNSEDFQFWLADEQVPALDRILYACWLDMGLRETLLNAPEKGAPADR